MNTPARVSSMPLERLWHGTEFLETSRLRAVGADDIRNLLRLGPVQFVIANISDPLYWVPLEERYTFWKNELDPHLVPLNNGVRPEDFPDAYCYFASEWSSTEGKPVILVCEKCH
ncbi:hypothetical protein [Armatimonas sp.]|uniref:hypothetical protein n=1 Tax=Armatimonas sp. TaxID=1872638 RepID=UPI00286A1025|nr:hypothetical protein [Armatimonas sp.]